MTKPFPLGARNPFEFGRELGPDELVDREPELAAIERVAARRGKLFFIGPRRYGKTSILNAVEQRLTARGAVVLRYDAEAFESLTLLAQALLTGAARKLTGPVAKASGVIGKFFTKLRPDVSYDLGDQKITVRLGTTDGGGSRSAELPVLTEVLDGIERMAKGHKKPVVVILDEFQQVVSEGGEAAERQIRAAIQKHRHVAYVFAGSKTRLLADLSGHPGRAFWKLGERRFLGPVPREDFRLFLGRGFGSVGFKTTPEGIERILDAAEDVPYNVQRLASECWERLRVKDDRVLTAGAVEEALRSVVASENPAYAQIWTNLTRAQKSALKAVIEEKGTGLLGRVVLHRVGLAASTMQRALEGLGALGIVRQDEAAGAIRFRLEDPFFAAWLAAAQGQ